LNNEIQGGGIMETRKKQIAHYSEPKEFDEIQKKQN